MGNLEILQLPLVGSHRTNLPLDDDAGLAVESQSPS